MCAIADAGDGDAALAAFAQPGIEVPVAMLLDTLAAANNRHERPLHPRERRALFSHRTVDVEGQPAARTHLVSVGGSKAPRIDVFAQCLIGEAQHLDRRGKGEHGKVWYQIENEQPSRLLRPVHGFVPWRPSSSVAGVPLLQLFHEY